MSRRPYRRKQPKVKEFRFSLWRRVTDKAARARRARWAADFAAKGIRAFERRNGGMVALFIEGTEATGQPEVEETAPALR